MVIKALLKTIIKITLAIYLSLVAGWLSSYLSVGLLRALFSAKPATCPIGAGMVPCDLSGLRFLNTGFEIWVITALLFQLLIFNILNISRPLITLLITVTSLVSLSTVALLLKTTGYFSYFIFLLGYPLLMNILYILYLKGKNIHK